MHSIVSFLQKNSQMWVRILRKSALQWLGILHASLALLLKPSSDFGCCPFERGSSVVVYSLLLLPFRDSVIVLCFVVRYFVSILVLQLF